MMHASHARFTIPRAFCIVLVGLILSMGLFGGRTLEAVTPHQLQPAQGSARVIVSGVLDFQYGDSHDQMSAYVAYVLSLSNGTRFDLTFANPPPFDFFQKPVKVTGHIAPGQAVASTRTLPTLIVDQIQLSQNSTLSASRTTGGVTAVTGTRKVIMLLLKFSDDTDVPNAPSFYDNLINPLSPSGSIPGTVNGFYYNNSWNQLQWSADVGGAGGVPATGWLTLPHLKSYYANCGWSSMCANLNAIASDGTAAGVAAGISFPQYDNINFVLSNDLDCCAWGGGWSGTLNGVYKSYGATWEPPWGQEAGTYSHEMGHSLGLPHSGWVYYAYDSPWDIMSARQSARTLPCATYFSRNDGSTRTVYCTNPGNDISGVYKDYLGWIDSAHEVTVNAASTTTVILEGQSLPLGTLNKLLKICLSSSPCSGFGAHYFTVEARVRSDSGDNGIPGEEGVIIHTYEDDRPPVGDGNPCFFNSQSGPAWPIDSTPGDWDSTNCNAGGRSYPNYALFNAQWGPGQTYVN